MTNIIGIQKFTRLAYATLLFLFAVSTSAFVGSDFEAGKSYYLFNIYQARFLSAESKLDNANAAKFAVNAGSMTIGGKTWTLSKNASGYYQLKNTGKFLAFEDKVTDAENPDDENRAKYLGGGVTCQPSANDTDRSYWMLISEEEYAEWMAKKKFTVASLNVDGMPKSLSLAGQEIKLNPDAKEEAGGTAIGKRLLTSGFDVVGVSEDFNYHSNIMDEVGTVYGDMTHRGILSVGNANLLNFLSQKPLFTTDGLELIYKKGVLTPSNEAFVKWNDHYGYTDNGADGLINKGYRYYLITLADGTEIDLYTMHMDAESSAEDNAARAKQLTQLVTAIKATNNKRPVIIIGDSNCRYTRDKLKELLIDAINADERFTIRDPWIQYGRNSAYPRYGSNSIMASTEGYMSGEVVDKIFYINNKESDIRLVAETYCQDLSFVDEEGSPLCDHKPCVVTFSYHEYDPATDDVAVIETTEDAVFLRNRGTGRYLMNGGWWGSHAVVGNYGKDVFIKSLPNGKYDISTKYGHITDAAYIDNNNDAEYIKEWTILDHDGYKVLAYNQNGTMKALTANDPTYFNNNPLYRYATTAPLNVNDELQQWEIVTKEMLNAEIAAATPNHPVNVTHLVKSANFDRIDWGGEGWTFDNKGNGDRVTDVIGGADNDAFSNFNRSVNTTQSGNWIKNSNNQWDCYQELTVPAGYYKVTCQGFAKGVTDCGYFYAWSNPEGEGSYKEEQVLLNVYKAADFTEDTQVAAGRAFDAGKYTNELPIIKVGSDGHLVVGVKKTKNNSTSGWFVFDNFQLFYLGDVNPDGEDINKDGNVDILDVEALVKIILGTYEGEHGKADLDGNGSVDIIDVTKLINILKDK